MKTSKQRAKIIIQRYNQSKNNLHESQELKKHKQLRAKKINLKTFIAYSMVAIVVVTGITLGLFFGLTKNDNPNSIYSKLYIVNFDKYSAIGSGSQISNSDKVNADTLRLISNSSEKNYLLGVDQYGNVEKLKFALRNNKNTVKEETEPEEIVQSDWRVIGIKILDRFIIVDFIIYDSDFYAAKYIIDNTTGIMYSLNIIEEGIAFISDYTQFFENEGTDREQSEDSIYFFSGFTNINDVRNVNKVFRAHVENDELVVEEIYNKDMGLACSTYFVDKYNNFYIRPYYSQYLYTKVSYCISNNKLLRIDTDLRKDVNGIVYTQDGTKQVNEYGELVDSTFSGEHMWLAPTDLVKKNGNIAYYYRAEVSKSNQIITGLDFIYKVTWLDDINYTFEKIYIQNWENMNPKQYVTTSDYIYFRSDEKIFKTEIATGLTVELVSEYYFTDINTDNLGNVSFVALNIDMQNVYGIINNNGDIDIDVQNREFRIYYIKPLKIVD